MEIKQKDKLVVLEKVGKKKQPLTSNVIVDEFTNKVSQAFDWEFKGENKFYPYELPNKIPKSFGIGIIVGASGTGKSTLLREFGEEEHIRWDSAKSIVSHFDNPDEAVRRMSAVGLNSIPSWTKPFYVLSNGEQFRANLARRLKNNCVVDEFTSVVDRNVAKSASVAISKYIKKNDIKNVVLATVHYDVIEWLEPDWVFDANEGILYDGRYLRRPQIRLDFYRIDKDIWRMFEVHHYLDAKLNKASHTYGVMWGDAIVGFTAVLPMPSGTIKGAWRGHRTVVLPDYQGMGIGTIISDTIGDIYISQGYKYFSRSAHIRFGNHREGSGKWRSTSTNNKLRSDMNQDKHLEKNPNWHYDNKRICYSHEYMGDDYDKPHLRIAISITNEFSLKLKYHHFENFMNKYLKKELEENYVVFLVGYASKEDTIPEEYAKNNKIRQENELSESKLKQPFSKYCDIAVEFGNGGEFSKKHKSDKSVRFFKFG